MQFTDMSDQYAEFDNHTFVASIVSKKSDLMGFIAIHRGGMLKPAFGATRVWRYANPDEAFRDALKLSRVMSCKSALADLPYGGAKAVLVDGKWHGKKRSNALRAYVDYVNLLHGHFITGADVGVGAKDLNEMALASRYIVGQASDPVRFTALGLTCALKVVLKMVFGSDDFSGRSFAIQGLGKTGLQLLSYIYDTSDTIYATDINEKAIEYAKTKFPRIKIVPFNDIYTQAVDIFSPCALSNVLNGHTYSLLKVKIILGSANCQLENDEIGDNLYRRGIIYAPDYVVNAGGYIAVVDEYESRRFSERRVISKVKKIAGTLEKILVRSHKINKPPHRVANDIAKRIYDNYM